MKKTKRLATIVAFGLTAFALTFAGCKNDDGDSDSTPTQIALTDEEQQESIENYAFNILRSLAALPTDSDDADDPGIETLPDDWQSLSLTADIGAPSPTDATVRLVSVNGVDDARNYVAGIVGEEVEGDSAIWNIPGLGTLNFTTTTTDKDIYATLTVSITQIPNLSQIQFVDAEYYEAQGPTNSYKGIPYYHAGDIIQRKKDGTLWMCVRPAGGPLLKDKSYWICLNPFDNKNQTIIKSEVKKNQVGYYDDDKVSKTSLVEIKADWTYAKNLMTLKTAKAAYHTLALLNMAQQDETNWMATMSTVSNALTVRNTAKGLIEGDDKFNLLGIYAQVGITKQMDSFDPSKFCIAYGSSKTDSNRKLTCKDKKNVTGKNASFPVAQPVISGTAKITDGKIKETIRTEWDTEEFAADYKKKNFCLSATDTYDEIFWLYTAKNAGSPGYGWPMDLRSELFGQEEYAEPFNPDEFHFDFRNYLHDYDKLGNGLAYVNPYRITAIFIVSGDCTHILFSPELELKDNAGTANEAKRPSSVSAFMDIYVNQNGFDWWDSLTYTTRTVDGTVVDWNKENQ